MGAVLNANYGEGKRGAVFHPCEMLGTLRTRWLRRESCCDCCELVLRIIGSTFIPGTTMFVLRLLSHQITGENRFIIYSLFNFIQRR